MYSKPNQKIVVNAEEAPKIDKNNKDAKKFVVSRIRGNEEEAMRNLNYGAFKLWLMFSADTKDFRRAFSPTQAEQDLGISQPTARSGLKELIEKGYLVQQGSSNIFEFHQLPQDEFEFVEEKRFIKTTKGELKAITYGELYERFKDKRSEEEIKNYWNKLPVEEVM